MKTEKLLKILESVANLARFLPLAGKLLAWITMAAVLYMIFGLIAPAYAQTGPVVADLAQYAESTPRGDWSLKLWIGILGDFANNPLAVAGEPATLLGRLFMYFNGAIFAVSTAWIGWGILKGTLGTATDGEALGKSISSVWYPIRTVVGVSGGLPLLGGFTLLQGVLMSAALIGIGIANYMWRAAVADPTMVQLVGTTAITGAPAVRPSQVVNAAGSMLRSNLCLVAHQQAAVIYKAEMEAAGAASSVPPEYSITRTLDAQTGSLRIRYGWPGDPEACGSVSVSMDNYRSEQSSDFRVASVDYRHIRNVISMKSSQQLIAADDLIRGLAEGWLQTRNSYRYGQTLERSVDVKRLQQIATDYAAQIQAIVTLSLADSGSSIKSAAQQKMLEHGWIGAGSWYSTFAEANSALADSISGLTFTYTAPDPEFLPSPVQEDLAALERAMQKASDRIVGRAGASPDDQKVDAVLKDACEPSFGQNTTSETGNCSLGQSIARRITAGLFAGSGGGSSWRDSFGLVNPVVAMKDAGDYILTIASTLIAAGPVLEIGGKVMSFFGAAATATGVGAPGGKAMSTVGAIASYAIPLGWTLLVVGAVMAIYIPALPWIVWMSAVFSYCASFLEGLIAAPLHSMSHMNTEGDGLGQATTKGYLFVLNALARPAIMVLGFFIASALIVGIGTLIAHTFASMIAGVQGNSMTGLASIIGLLVVYIVVNITLIQQSFELIGVLPDQIIGYLGAGDAGQTLGRDAQTKINAAVMSATRQGMGGAQASVAAGSKAVQKLGGKK